MLGLRTLNLDETGLTGLDPDIRGTPDCVSSTCTATSWLVCPAWLGGFTDLRVLDLSHQDITALPDSLGGLSWLEFLYVSGPGDLDAAGLTR
jgi:Leucine-rich repeat (LRR) protein